MNKNSFVMCFILLYCVGITSVLGQKYRNFAMHVTEVYLGGIDEPDKSDFEEKTKGFLDAINSAYLAKKNPALPSSIANNTINERLGNLWAVSPFCSANTQVIEDLLHTKTGNYEVRNLQLLFEEADSGYHQQSAVLIFDASGNIIDFKVALLQRSYRRVFSDKTDVTDLRRRQMIVSFVEDFRTAYTIRDINYLDQVFSKHALIITGKVLQDTPENEWQSKVKYTVQTKEDYLTRLKAVFARTKILSLNFDSIEVIHHPKVSHLYGVQLKQTWNSTTLDNGKYFDVGYLFLIIDFYDEAKPKIWVRAWSLNDFFSLDNFVIHDTR